MGVVTVHVIHPHVMEQKNTALKPNNIIVIVIKRAKNIIAEMFVNQLLHVIVKMVLVKLLKIINVVVVINHINVTAMTFLLAVIVKMCVLPHLLAAGALDGNALGQDL